MAIARFATSAGCRGLPPLLADLAGRNERRRFQTLCTWQPGNAPPGALCVKKHPVTTVKSVCFLPGDPPVFFLILPLQHLLLPLPRQAATVPQDRPSVEQLVVEARRLVARQEAPAGTRKSVSF